MTRALVFICTSAPLVASHACTLCDSATGVQVREGIAGGFGATLLAVLAPFPVLLLAVGLVNYSFSAKRDDER